MGFKGRNKFDDLYCERERGLSLVREKIRGRLASGVEATGFVADFGKAKNSETKNKKFVKY